MLLAPELCYPPVAPKEKYNQLVPLLTNFYHYHQQLYDLVPIIMTSLCVPALLLEQFEPDEHKMYTKIYTHLHTDYEREMKYQVLNFYKLKLWFTYLYPHYNFCTVEKKFSLNFYEKYSHLKPYFFQEHKDIDIDNRYAFDALTMLQIREISIVSPHKDRECRNIEEEIVESYDMRCLLIKPVHINSIFELRKNMPTLQYLELLNDAHNLMYRFSDTKIVKASMHILAEDYIVFRKIYNIMENFDIEDNFGDWTLNNFDNSTFNPVALYWGITLNVQYSDTEVVSGIEYLGSSNISWYDNNYDVHNADRINDKSWGKNFTENFIVALDYFEKKDPCPQILYSEESSIFSFVVRWFWHCQKAICYTGPAVDPRSAIDVVLKPYAANRIAFATDNNRLSKLDLQYFIRNYKNRKQLIFQADGMEIE